MSDFIHIPFLSYALLLPYIILSIIHLKACFRGNSCADISKLFLMPVLLIYYAASVFITGIQFHWLIAAALLFSTAGDWFLLDERTAVRIRLGMAAFSCTQLCYVLLGFSLIQWNTPTGIFAALVALVYVSVGIFMYVQLWAHIQHVKWMVLIYLICITLMSWIFVTAAFSTHQIPLILAAAGSLVFMLSDALLSKKLFICEYPKARFLVMSTYIFAQLLIIVAFVHL